MIDFDALAGCRRRRRPNATSPSGDLAQIVYTSGTESLPEGRDADPRRGHLAVCELHRRRRDRRATISRLHALPLYHCAQLDVFLGPAIYVGATNVITAQPTPDNLLPLIETPAHHLVLRAADGLDHPAALAAFDATDLSSLQQGLLRRLDHAGRGAAGARAAPAGRAAVESLRPDRDRAAGDHARPRGPAAQARLVRAARCSMSRRAWSIDAMRDVPPGEVGEIVHRSPHLMLGYCHDDERTAAAFAGGWFHSGDLATIDDEGYLTVVDRKKDMIKTGGENVASREVEEALYRAAAVSEVAVIGVPHPRWVEAVVAVVVRQARA